MRALLPALLFLASGVALAQHGTQRVEHAMGDDVFAAGSEATSRTAVGGDLVLAGGRVQVDGSVGGDLVVAGGRVRIDAPTQQDLYAAGGRVTLEGAVGRNARMAGGNVEIGRGAIIAGNATVAGGEVALAGEVRGHLAVAGGHMFLNGRVEGNVDAAGGEIELGPDARIAGELRYRSRAALVRSPTAEVAGRVTREAMPPSWDDAAETPARVAGVLLLLWTLGVMILAAIVAALPRLSARLEHVVRWRPGMSLLAGFAVLFATPFVAAFLLATGIGVPAGLLLLGAYLAALVLGYVGAGVVAGRMALRRIRPASLERTWVRALAASLAILVISLLIALPFLGWIVVLAAWLAGIGALLLQLRAPPSASAA